MGNRISHPNFLRRFDTGNYITYIACTHFIPRRHLQLQNTHLIGIIFLTGSNELHVITFADHPIFYLEISNDSPERIEYRVENQALQRSFRITFRSRNTFYNCVQYIFHAFSRLSTGTQNITPVTTQQVDDFIFNFFRHGTRQINLIQNRNNLQIILNCHVKIGYCLRLNSLRRIHNQ